jgi:hypothetical protein
MPDVIPPPVVTEFGMPPPDAAPLNLTQLFTLANKLVSSRIDGNYLPYVLQSGQPSVNDQDKVWFEQDSQGRPVAVKVWWIGSGPNGAWRRIYNGMMGEIRGFHGAPGYGPAPALFNTNGMGNVGLEYDGWHLCNGKDGTPDLSDKFICGAHMNKLDSKSDYEDGEWQTMVAGGDNPKHTGGAKDFTLSDATTWRPVRPDLWVGRWTASTPQRDDDSLMYGFPKKVATGTDSGTPDPNDPPNHLILPKDEGNAEPNPVSVINPFVALGWIIFVGYQS